MLEKDRRTYKEALLASVIPWDIAPDEKDLILFKLEEAKQKIMPRSLFRYRAFSDFSISALLEDKIYFSKPIDFNDPYDCLYYVPNTLVDDILNQEFDVSAIEVAVNDIRSGNITADSINEPNFQEALAVCFAQIARADKKDIERLLGETLKQSLKEMRDEARPKVERIYHDSRQFNLIQHREEIGVACFSEDVKSILMWSHYADYHKGFCLEYDTGDMQNLQQACCAGQYNKQRMLELLPVVYSETRYDATKYEEELLKHRMQYEVTNESGKLYIPDLLHFIKTNTIKSRDWAYEEEWRFIYSRKSSNVPISSAVLRPKAIYLGSKISRENKDVLLKLIEGKGIDVYEMYMDESNRGFKLSCKKIV